MKVLEWMWANCNQPRFFRQLHRTANSRYTFDGFQPVDHEDGPESNFLPTYTPSGSGQRPQGRVRLVRTQNKNSSKWLFPSPSSTPARHSRHSRCPIVRVFVLFEHSRTRDWKWDFAALGWNSLTSNLVAVFFYFYIIDGITNGRLGVCEYTD